ncbi:hypothetical protein ACVW0P_003357 [Mucilaginibacter sp. UYNi724]
MQCNEPPNLDSWSQLILSTLKPWLSNHFLFIQLYSIGLFLGNEYSGMIMQSLNLI